MARPWFPAITALLLLASQAGWAAMPGGGGVVRASLQPVRLDCDTSVKYIPLAARFQNTTGQVIEFNLVDDHGPPLHLWYYGYRLHAGAPGEPLAVVHNSPRNSDWIRKIRLEPGAWADFDVPLFGLRPDDYRHHFRIEMRDSNDRSYWTQEFDLCSVPRGTCGCPGPGALSIGAQAPLQACTSTTSNDRCN